MQAVHPGSIEPGSDGARRKFSAEVPDHQGPASGQRRRCKGCPRVSSLRRGSGNLPSEGPAELGTSPARLTRNGRLADASTPPSPYGKCVWGLFLNDPGPASRGCSSCEHSEFVHADRETRPCLYSNCQCGGFQVAGFPKAAEGHLKEVGKSTEINAYSPGIGYRCALPPHPSESVARSCLKAPLRALRAPFVDIKLGGC